MAFDENEQTWTDRETPPNQHQYSDWLKHAHSVDMSAERAYYEQITPKLVSAAIKSEFWDTYKSQRQELDDVYRGETGYKLFAFSEDAEPSAKGWDSFSLKTFRKNVLDNPNWPDAPKSGWLLPDNWFTDVHDIVRTSLVVKYLDGVKLLTSALQDIAALSKTPFASDLQARDTGYYAAHTYGTYPVEVPSRDFALDLERMNLELEIQITTQLQEVIGRLTHEQYEKRRIRPASASKNWQWDHSDEAFQPNYLGHLLHYAEGMIMEVRERGRS